MNREEIIRMAHEAGLCDADGEDDNSIGISRYLERFAKLVYESVFRDANMAASATIIDAAVLAEREACAKLCQVEAQSREESAHKNHGAGTPAYGRRMAGVNAANNCAKAIRARSNT